MTHEDAFMAAIIAAPADDGPRLLLADWLDEQGQSPRADFIRGAFDPRVRLPAPWPELMPEVEPLVKKLDLELWFGPVRLRYQSVETFGPAARVRHGFVDSVTLPVAAWLASGPAFVRAAPLKRVQLSDRTPFFSAGRWRWLHGRRGCNGFSFVPTRLCRFWPDPWERLSFTQDELAACYRTRREADDAVSAACLAWAKGRPRKTVTDEAAVARRIIDMADATLRDPNGTRHGRQALERIRDTMRRTMQGG